MDGYYIAQGGQKMSIPNRPLTVEADFLANKGRADHPLHTALVPNKAIRSKSFGGQQRLKNLPLYEIFLIICKENSTFTIYTSPG